MKKTILQFPESMFIDSHLLYCIGISQKKKKKGKQEGSNRNVHETFVCIMWSKQPSFLYWQSVSFSTKGNVCVLSRFSRVWPFATQPNVPCQVTHGTLQARILDCVAISFSRGPSWPRGLSLMSHILAGNFFTTSAMGDSSQEIQPCSTPTTLMYIWLYVGGMCACVVYSYMWVYREVFSREAESIEERCEIKGKEERRRSKEYSKETVSRDCSRWQILNL